jgi:hypothetical protein
VEAKLARACARSNEPGKRFICPFQQHSLVQCMAGARFVFQFLEEYLDVGRQALSGILLSLSGVVRNFLHRTMVFGQDGGKWRRATVEA